MGATGSKEDTEHLQKSKDVWLELESHGRQKIDSKKLIQKYSNWKTIRIFVACTFKDFKNERHLLHTKLYNELQPLCESKKLLLIIEDFHLGGKDELTSPDFYLSLDALEECYQDNIAPFFLAMLGECSGHVPSETYLDADVLQQFGLASGLSVLESQIAFGAHRIDNPNGLFMARDPSFLSSIPFHKVQFIEDGPGRKRMTFLKDKLKDTTPSSRYVTYTCASEGVTDPHHQFVRLKNLNKFQQTVTEFFKKRIEQQYQYDSSKHDPDKVCTESHWRALCRMENINSVDLRELAGDIYQKLADEEQSNLFLLSSEYGCGKSSLLALLIRQLLPKDGGECSLKSGKKPYKVFYHFTSDALCGQNPENLFRRILREIYKVSKSSITGDLNVLRAQVTGRLSNPESDPLILIIDDADLIQDSKPVSWVPANLPKQVKVILSFSKESAIPKSLKHSKPTPNSIGLPYLNKIDAKALINKNIRHVPRGAVPASNKLSSNKLSVTTPLAFDKPDRPTTARRQTADAIVNLVPVTTFTKTQASRQGSIDETRSYPRRLWSAGVGAAKRRISMTQSMGAMENGKVRKVVFSGTKCRILAAMLKKGKSLEKVKALAYFSTIGLAEAELVDFESEIRGHLLLGTLFLLQTSQRGLREIELRQLMANEPKLIGELIKRRINPPVGFEVANTGSTMGGQRWRDVFTRLSHHLVEIGEPGEHRLAIGSTATKRALEKRYLNNKSIKQHFEQKLATYFDSTAVILRDRKPQELPYHLMSLGENQKLAKALVQPEIVERYVNPHYSGKFFKLWTEGVGELNSFETKIMEALSARVEASKNKAAVETTQSFAYLAATLLIQANQLDSAAKMVQTLIEFENKTSEKPKPERMGNYHLLQGEIQHKKTIKSHELSEWVAWEELSRIPYVTAAYDTAVEYFKSGQETDKVKLQLAKCYLRLAFWHFCQEKHISQDGEKTYGSANKFVSEAEQLYAKSNDVIGQTECLMIRAQCLNNQDEIRKMTDKATELVTKSEGIYSMQLLRIYAVGMRLLNNSNREMAEKSKNICQVIYKSGNKEKYTIMMALIEELGPGKVPATPSAIGTQMEIDDEM